MIDDDELSLDLSEEDVAQDVMPDAGAVTWGTDWTVTTVIDQLRRERFDLEPAFQRRDVWSATKRSRLIESLILGIPVPQLILAERSGARGKFIVLDGKQRLRSIQQFAGLNGSFMRLTGLEVLRDLNGKTYEDLRQRDELDQYLAAFENQAIRAVVLRGWENEGLLYLTFLRLNSNVVGLSPQELRRALHPGPFMDYVMETSAESAQLRNFLGIKSSSPDFRMRDAEILIRHIALSLRLDFYRGDLRKFLDETCGVLNQKWSKFSTAIEGHAAGLESAMEATVSIFEGDAFRKFANDRYERTKNRAVLDCMTFHLQDRAVRDAALAAPDRVRQAFVETCTNDDEFQASLTSTTKTRGAVLARLGTWGKALTRALDVETLAVPEV
ncbi:DUF262 domain-containing protein [Nocardia goodfellowii]